MSSTVISVTNASVWIPGESPCGITVEDAEMLLALGSLCGIALVLMPLIVVACGMLYWMEKSAKKGRKSPKDEENPAEESTPVGTGSIRSEITDEGKVIGGSDHSDDADKTVRPNVKGKPTETKSPAKTPTTKKGSTQSGLNSKTPAGQKSPKKTPSAKPEGSKKGSTKSVVNKKPSGGQKSPKKTPSSAKKGSTKSGATSKPSGGQKSPKKTPSAKSGGSKKGSTKFGVNSKPSGSQKLAQPTVSKPSSQAKVVGSSNPSEPKKKTSGKEKKSTGQTNSKTAKNTSKKSDKDTSKKQ